MTMIESQDGMILVNAEHASAFAEARLADEDGNQTDTFVVVVVMDGNEYTLGTYSTEQRASDALANLKCDLLEKVSLIHMIKDGELD